MGKAPPPFLTFPSPPLPPINYPTQPKLQVVDPQLDALAHTLLKQLRQLDGMERAGAVVPPTTALASLAAAEHSMAAAVAGLAPLAPAVAGDPAAAALAALPDSLLGAPQH